MHGTLDCNSVPVMCPAGRPQGRRALVTMIRYSPSRIKIFSTEQFMGFCTTNSVVFRSLDSCLFCLSAVAHRQYVGSEPAQPSRPVPFPPLARPSQLARLPSFPIPAHSPAFPRSSISPFSPPLLFFFPMSSSTSAHQSSTSVLSPFPMSFPDARHHDLWCERTHAGKG